MNKLEKFLASPRKQAKLAKAIDKFAILCAMQSIKSGFAEDQRGIINLVDEHGTSDQMDWLYDCILQAELARIGSEVGEAVEAVRKPQIDKSIPDMENFIVEIADILIRCGDTAKRAYFNLGPAVVKKMLYNATRPYKHGKQS